MCNTSPWQLTLQSGTLKLALCDSDTSGGEEVDVCLPQHFTPIPKEATIPKSVVKNALKVHFRDENSPEYQRKLEQANIGASPLIF